MADFKPIRWMFEGDKWSAMKLMGLAKNQLFKLKNMQDNGANLFILSQHYRDGSFISARTDVPGMDILRIRTKEEEKKIKEVKETKECNIYAFTDFYQNAKNIIVLDKDLKIIRDGIGSCCGDTSIEPDTYQLAWGGGYDKDYFYIGTQSDPFQLMKFKKKDVSMYECNWFYGVDTEISLETYCVLVDKERGYTYFGGYESYDTGLAMFRRYYTEDEQFQNLGDTRHDTAYGYYWSSVGMKDCGYMAVYSSATYTRIIEIDYETGTIIREVTPPYGMILGDATKEIKSDGSDGDYIYFASAYNTYSLKDGRVLQYKVKDIEGNRVLEYIAAVVLNLGSDNRCYCVVYHNGYIYAHSVYRIYKIKVPEMTIVNSIESPLFAEMFGACASRLYDKVYFAGRGDESGSTDPSWMIIVDVVGDKFEIKDTIHFGSDTYTPGYLNINHLEIEEKAERITKENGIVIERKKL